MANLVHGPASFWTQANALLRKNFIFQIRDGKSNIRLISVPIILCLLLVLLQNWVNKELIKSWNRCGCKCVDKNGDGKCEEVCGIEYSDLNQATSCSIPSPMEWPPLLQIPESKYRAVRTDSISYGDLLDDSCKISGSCPATVLLTGTNQTFGEKISCVKGLHLWRNSSDEINDELYKGYRNGNPEEKINEIIAGSSGALCMNDFNHNHAISASNAYIQLLLGPSARMLFEFVKEMPKPETELTLDFASLLGPLFFTWVVSQLFPVILIAQVYEKQQKLRIMMKMHGLGDGGWIIVMELYPGFSLFRGFYEFSYYAFKGNYLGTDGMRWKDLSDEKNGMKEVLIIMLVQWLVLLFLAYYIDQIASSGKDPLFFLLNSRKKPSHSIRKLGSGRQGSKVFVQMEKPDVAQERERVEQLLESSTNHGIICDNLKKVYPGKDGNPEKIAVKGLSLALSQRECFGMLGPNGAGKTTFINMMIGLIKPSSGTAYARGMDIHTDMNKIYTNMGVCPQHDLVWEILTGREHLLFYGRLKNLKGPELTQAVEESLKSVNLFHGGIADKQVGKYSGGMKRRLSVAISLIGDPKVVYMDEPSTGLDPSSRSNLWNVVKRAKQDRAIILTTHSMEEAEHLCDRLGIFVDGSLQCIGNPKELKARHGGSYVFTMTTSSDNEEEVEHMVRRLCPNAHKIYHISGTQKFELPKEEVRIADVFQAVEKAKSRFTVYAWGLADTTLEDVFIKVARTAHAFNDINVTNSKESSQDSILDT
ncbi:hypothetical protein RND71_029823 [Anisodus tanguticus]|uniref:ABC transporter domain-containing protein n=1 Tax=Anisodus tanguticus TaxID=243964 RepID=A0AAE1RE55_9SOLA|nr:hypothetical protein RND71_029823 [Anisodus tanguticus]